MNAVKNDHADIAKMSFEQALKELEIIVRKLESGQGDLESSISDYTRGTALRAHCQKTLDDARMRVEKIMKQPGGEPALVPFDPES